MAFYFKEDNFISPSDDYVRYAENECSYCHDIYDDAPLLIKYLEEENFCCNMCRDLYQEYLNKLEEEESEITHEV